MPPISDVTGRVSTAGAPQRRDKRARGLLTLARLQLGVTCPLKTGVSAKKTLRQTRMLFQTQKDGFWNQHPCAKEGKTGIITSAPRRQTLEGGRVNVIKLERERQQGR